MANEQLQNAPTPTLMYPPSADVYLQSRVHDLTRDVCNLINAIVTKDQKIAAMEARIAELEAAGRLEHAQQVEVKPNGAVAPV